MTRHTWGGNLVQNHKEIVLNMGSKNVLVSQGRGGALGSVCDSKRPFSRTAAAPGRRSVLVVSISSPIFSSGTAKHT